MEENERDSEGRVEEEDYEDDFGDEFDNQYDEHPGEEQVAKPPFEEFEDRAADVLTPENYTLLVGCFLDFLTVSIHTILYERGLYPKESFISARKYNFPVRQSRHPDVCDWINDAVNHIKKELLGGTIENVSLVIFSPGNDPMERFVFDLTKFPVVYLIAEETKKDNEEGINTEDEEPEYQSEDVKLKLINMDEQFRAVMSKLSFCHQHLEDLPVDCTFSIAIQLRDDAPAPITHPQPWIPVPSSLQVEKDIGEDSLARVVGVDVGGVTTTPIRSVETGPMCFEMWIEEGQRKPKKVERIDEEYNNGSDQVPLRRFDKKLQSGGKYFAGEAKAVEKTDKIERSAHQPHFSEDNSDEYG